MGAASIFRAERSAPPSIEALNFLEKEDSSVKVMNRVGVLLDVSTFSPLAEEGGSMVG
jgi:hypothetical protein